LGWEAAGDLKQIIHDAIRDINARGMDAVTELHGMVDFIDQHPALSVFEEIDRQLAQAEHQTKLLRAQLDEEREARLFVLQEHRQAQHARLLELKRSSEIADAAREGEVREQRLLTQAREAEVALLERQRQQELELARLREQTEAAVRQAGAFSPELVAALTRLGDAQLLSALSANFGELAAVEGRGLLETARKFLDFMPQTAVPVLRTAKPAAREGDAE